MIVRTTAAGHEKRDPIISAPLLPPAETRPCHAGRVAGVIRRERSSYDRYREGRSEVLVVDPPVFEVLEPVVVSSATI
jgi:hypothetical protein